MSVLYEVTASVSDPAVAEEWVRWMRDGHIADVVRAGATSGRLLRVEEGQGEFVAQYEFASRATLEGYFREHAPRLRAEGAGRFPPEKVRLTRRILIPADE